MAAAVSPRSRFAVPRAAVAASLVAHVLVALAVSRLEWPAAPDEQAAAPTTFVWAVPPLARRAVDSRPLEPPSAVPQPRVEPLPQQESAAEAEPEAAPDERASAAEAAREPAAASETAPAAPTVPTAPVRPEIDWEAERRAAMARALEQENRYRPFGPDPNAALEDPDEAPRPSMFSDRAGRRGRSGPSVLVPGQARTRVGRWLSNLCQITGGISLFGVASACVAEEIDRGRYWYLRPTYLKRLPVCEDTRPGTAGSVAEPGSQYSTVKCRLEAEIEP